MPLLPTSLKEATSDVFLALKKYDVALVFGIQDISQRYRRSRIGVFWLTINMGVMILALGMIFGTILRAEMKVFLPFMCISLIFWELIASSISEGCTGFVDSSGLILQTRIPFFTHIARLIIRNTIILMHNILIFPIVIAVYGVAPSWTWFLVLPGFFLLIVNLAWLALLLATLCARFRDMTQVVKNIIMIFFYVTPIVWMPTSLPSGSSHRILTYNPFYHLMETVREPLLGQMPTALNWQVSIGVAVFGWLITLLLFGRFKTRIAYWL